MQRLTTKVSFLVIRVVTQLHGGKKRGGKTSDIKNFALFEEQCSDTKYVQLKSHNMIRMLLCAYKVHHAGSVSLQ